MVKNCLACNDEFQGRIDKIFCTPYCKSNYHYEKNKAKSPTFYHLVKDQLHRNHRLLKHYNRSGKSTVRAETIIAEGFNPNIFTHYWKNKKGQVYLFCFDQGFLSVKEKNKKKYLLVTWQDNYMTIPLLSHP